MSPPKFVLVLDPSEATSIDWHHDVEYVEPGAGPMFVTGIDRTATLSFAPGMMPPWIVEAMNGHTALLAMGGLTWCISNIGYALGGEQELLLRGVTETDADLRWLDVVEHNAKQGNSMPDDSPISADWQKGVGGKTLDKFEKLKDCADKFEGMTGTKCGPASEFDKALSAAVTSLGKPPWHPKAHVHPWSRAW